MECQSDSLPRSRRIIEGRPVAVASECDPELYRKGHSMNVKKYIGMDVHQETISVAVMTGKGKLVMESIIETKASTILQFVQGLHGDLHVTFEEGTWAAWLYDLMKPHVAGLVV